MFRSNCSLRSRHSCCSTWASHAFLVRLISASTISAIAGSIFRLSLSESSSLPLHGPIKNPLTATRSAAEHDDAAKPVAASVADCCGVGVICSREQDYGAAYELGVHIIPPQQLNAGAPCRTKIRTLPARTHCRTASNRPSGISAAALLVLAACSCHLPVIRCWQIGLPSPLLIRISINAINNMLICSALVGGY